MEDALEFFEACGFVCPVAKDPGSFMQEVTTPIGQVEFANAALRSQKGLPQKYDVSMYAGHHAQTPGTGLPQSCSSLSDKHGQLHVHRKPRADSRCYSLLSFIAACCWSCFGPVDLLLMQPAHAAPSRFDVSGYSSDGCGLAQIRRCDD